MTESDLARLKLIHAKFYDHDFPFPDFTKSFLGAFVIENDDGSIVTAGGVRVIPESVLLTNKDFSVKERRQALLEAKEASIYLCQREGFNSLHAFVEKNTWEHSLMKAGFVPTAGNPLVITF